MEIPEIKARLPLSRVLAHYGWTPNARGRVRCPFHEDTTPSLQRYLGMGAMHHLAREY